MRESNSKTTKNAALLNDHAFTMLEMLLALSVFLLIASILPLGMKFILDGDVGESGIRRMEWEVFSSQVKKEIRSAEQLTIQPDKLLLKVDGKLIIYEKYSASMRRRVNYVGHEILVQRLASFSFEKIADGVEIRVTDLNGVQYSSRVYYFYQIGGVTP
jgi:competence protein ComGF